MMLFRKSIVANEPVVNYKPFSNSQMGRGLLFSGVTTKCGQEILFMTSHLESMKEYGQARIEQLHNCFDFMNKTNAKNVIFGGDLNARDAEIKSLSPQVEFFHFKISLFLEPRKIQGCMGAMWKRCEQEVYVGFG